MINQVAKSNILPLIYNKKTTMKSQTAYKSRA
jgi:hypothetical protein